jgi:hypothetical protein
MRDVSTRSGVETSGVMPKAAAPQCADTAARPNHDGGNSTMANSNPSLDITRLHALAGRLTSHSDALFGHAEMSAIARDVFIANTILDAVAAFLDVLADKLPPDDPPEPSRASHYSP